jgi:hypothetical protein
MGDAMRQVCESSVHEAIKLNPVAWARLPVIGISRIPAGETWDAYDLVHANCACGSTLAIEVPVCTAVAS